ncbi:MAG TPA: helix-turn-helix transcriptional regulator [Acidimicrobiales bacterium]|nr:helix-turn-helix transcriptional regulator [Acidimicrobiales bacterium]
MGKAQGPAGRSAVLRTALLALLAERDSHGYDLVPRLETLGLNPDMAGVYRTLRSMDRRGELRSTWDTSSQGPPRRVYSVTEEGQELLRRAVAGMEAENLAMLRLLAHCRRRGLGARASRTT